jgi:hypothetical protein
MIELFIVAYTFLDQTKAPYYRDRPLNVRHLSPPEAYSCIAMHAIPQKPYADRSSQGERAQSWAKFGTLKFARIGRSAASPQPGNVPNDEEMNLCLRAIECSQSTGQ